MDVHQVSYIDLQENYRNPSINTVLISTTLITTVKLFVTTALLAQGQTSVITVKIGALVSGV